MAAASPLLAKIATAKKARSRALKMMLRLEGGHFWSISARQILAKYGGVRIGAYTYGECFALGAFPTGVSIGRYCSIAPGVRVFIRNHPTERLSMHPFFYNAHLGMVSSDTISNGTLDVGPDTWIGERAIITPGCSRIGIGAVVGAGAVVTKDVPDFAIVAGNPAKVIRMRFEEHTQDVIRSSEWWQQPVSTCVQFLESMYIPVPRDASQHPLLAGQYSESKVI
jgi:virginiamycin A acetyltransferase